MFYFLSGPLSGSLALNSGKVQSEDQKKVFTFDQHPKPLFSIQNED